MGFVSDIISTITDVVQSGAATNAAKVANAISPVFFAAIGVYIIFIAYEIIYSQKDVIMSEVTKTIMSFALIGAFTYSSPYYAQYVIPFVMNSGQELSGAITGSSDVANNIDSMWDSLTRTLDAFIVNKTQQLDIFDFGGYIGAYTIYFIGYIGGGILIFYSTVFLVVSTMAVGIALSVGVLFICFSVFSSTRNMFTLWCGTCLNYILLSLFYTISFSFVLTMIEKNMISDDAISLYKVVMLLLIITVSVFLIEHIGVMCSSLTGGVGINGLTSAASGIGGRASSSLLRASGMKSFANGFGSKLGKSSFNAGRSTASKLQQMASRGSKVLGG